MRCEIGSPPRLLKTLRGPLPREGWLRLFRWPSFGRAAPAPQLVQWMDHRPSRRRPTFNR